MTTRIGPLRSLAAALAVWLFLAPATGAYETDQYTGRLNEIGDATAALNARTNLVLEDIVRRWHGRRDERRFARKVYRRLGGRHWVDKIERWAIRSETVDKLPQSPPRGIYAGVPFWAGRFAVFFGLGPTIRVNDALIGTDKLGHFVSQGYKYYRRHLRGADETRVTQLGRRNEAGLFGRSTTGVFSNADLVANYEGYLFFRGLFEDGFVAGKGALVGWHGDKPYLLRPFDWADHVNDYWDEAVLPSRYDRFVRGRIRANLERLCADYAQAPERFVPRREDELERRYAHIGLRPAAELRLDRLCGGD